MLKEIKTLARAGGSVIPVRKNDKAPTQSDWSEAPTLTEQQVAEQSPKWHNYGIRPGAHSKLKNGDYLITIDLDIKDPSVEKEALAKLKELIPDIDEFLVVHSGNKLGPSRHYVGSTDKALRSGRLAKSDKKIKGSDGKMKDAFQIDIIGTGKQHVGPGSMHPDGFEYEIADSKAWNNTLEDWANGTRSAFIKSGVFTAEQKSDRKRSKSNEDVEPVDMSDDEIEQVLRNLPEKRLEDYESWLEVGMALQHQFADDPEYGLELWHWISKKSDKYDAEVLEDKWKSFKDDKGENSITFRTLIKESNIEKRNKKSISEAESIRAKPYDWPNAQKIPRRRWLYGRHYLCNTVSATIAPGGMGKSSLGVVEALAMVTGKPLLQESLPEGPLNVWYMNLEEPKDELHRRLAAARLHHGIKRSEIKGTLCVSGNELELKLAEENNLGFNLNENIVDALSKEILKHQFDVWIIDPDLSPTN